MIYQAKPFICAIAGLVGIATFSPAGVLFGGLLVAIGFYIAWMRSRY